MDILIGSLTACWEGLGPLRSLLPAYCSLSPVIEVGGQKFSVVKLLAEGGYSFVYLVREQEASTEGVRVDYALKKVLAVTAEQLSDAKQEIALMASLSHPNILPLVASSINIARSPEGGVHQVVYMLFPLYQSRQGTSPFWASIYSPAAETVQVTQEGSLFDAVTALAVSGGQMRWQDVLDIFYQICRAVSVLHKRKPMVAHRDIKPHNVLLQHRRTSRARHTAAVDAADEAESLQESHRHIDAGSYQAALMDFGSARPARVVVRNRTEALTLQEEAEKLCSAPYRAPELFDVASQCTIDERTDVWSLGCVLYFMLYGVSPFEKVLDEAGGSLALAVINGSLSFPPQDQRPEELKSIVRLCLNTDPQARPFLDDILRQVEHVPVSKPL